MKEYTKRAIFLFFGIIALAGVASVVGYSGSLFSFLIIVPLVYWVWKWDDERKDNYGSEA